MDGLRYAWVVVRHGFFVGCLVCVLAGSVTATDATEETLAQCLTKLTMILAGDGYAYSAQLDTIDAVEDVEAAVIGLRSDLGSFSDEVTTALGQIKDPLVEGPGSGVDPPGGLDEMGSLPNMNPAGSQVEWENVTLSEGPDYDNEVYDLPVFAQDFVPRDFGGFPGPDDFPDFGIVDPFMGEIHPQWSAVSSVFVMLSLPMTAITVLYLGGYVLSELKK